MELKCYQCGAEGKDNVYVKVVQDGEEKLACVSCLPALIHGSH